MSALETIPDEMCSLGAFRLMTDPKRPSGIIFKLHGQNGTLLDQTRKVERIVHVPAGAAQIEPL